MTSRIARRVLAAGPLAVVLVGGPSPFAALAPQDDPTPSVACVVAGDHGERLYRFDRPAGDAAWRLSMRSLETRDEWIVLPLPDAHPDIEGSAVTLAYTSANGGRIVRLATAPTPTLDVYVSYELEVNVDASLRPEIDLLNTHGSVAPVSCRIERAGTGADPPPEG